VIFPALLHTGIEETWQIQQQQIVSAVEQGAARKAFDLNLPDLGPYSMAYTRAGRHIVLGGARGHLAVMEWQRGHLTCEVQVGPSSTFARPGNTVVAHFHLAFGRVAAQQLAGAGPFVVESLQQVRVGGFLQVLQAGA
jgi:hypothetical protein